MNVNTISAECAHGMCDSCRYDDCACYCHLDEETSFLLAEMAWENVSDADRRE